MMQLQKLLKRQLPKKTGARGLRSILKIFFLKLCLNCLIWKMWIKVTVDSSAVKGNSEPIVTYGKKTSTSVA